MAIEDAATLANLLASNPSSDKESLVNVGVQYGSARSKRVANVAKVRCAFLQNCLVLTHGRIHSSHR